MSRKTYVFFLPYAGGSKYSYNDFKQIAPEEICLVPVELPGRGSRCKEKLITNANDLAIDIFYQIRPKLGVGEYVIFGHSMGALLGYLVTKIIIEEKLPLPVSLIFSGAQAPSLICQFKKRSELPFDQFIQAVKELGGMPHEVLRDQQLLRFFEPILRADFKAVEQYHYDKTEPFPIPLSVLIGTEEDISLQEAQEWQSETVFPLEIHQFPGDHFFLFDYAHPILKIILSKITVNRTYLNYRE